MSADLPLTADELATIRARAEACSVGAGSESWPVTTLRLVAEIERLRAENADVYEVHEHLIGRAETEARRAHDAEAEIERLQGECDLLSDRLEDEVMRRLRGPA